MDAQAIDTVEDTITGADSPVERAFAHLSEELAQLEDAAGSLIARIGPVLSPITDEDADGSGDAATRRSDVVERLDAHTARARRARFAIQGALARVEL